MRSVSCNLTPTVHPTAKWRCAAFFGILYEIHAFLTSPLSCEFGIINTLYIIYGVLFAWSEQNARIIEKTHTSFSLFHFQKFSADFSDVASWNHHQKF